MCRPGEAGNTPLQAVTPVPLGHVALPATALSSVLYCSQIGGQMALPPPTPLLPGGRGVRRQRSWGPSATGSCEQSKPSPAWESRAPRWVEGFRTGLRRRREEAGGGPLGGGEHEQSFPPTLRRMPVPISHTHCMRLHLFTVHSRTPELLWVPSLCQGPRGNWA